MYKRQYISKNATITNDHAYDYYEKASSIHYVENLTIENSTLYGGINFGSSGENTSSSDVLFKNSTIVNNLDETGAFGALAFYGTTGTVNNINFEDCYVGELSTDPGLPPVIFVDGFNITNINFTDTCLFNFGGMYTIVQGGGAAIDIGNSTFDCADIFFPPTVNDEIVSVDTSTSVVRGTKAIVSIEYSAMAARDITVDFRLMSAPYTNYASEVVSVNAGTGTVDVEIDIPSDVPVANNAYRYRIFLLPTGQTGWGNSLDSAYPSNISVIDGAPPTGDLINVTVSKNVVRGTTENLSIDYSVSHTSDISVEFKLMASPYTTYSSALATVNPGSGNEQVSINIPANVPVANEAYRYRIFLLPTGQTGWSNSLDSAYPGKISVTDQGTNLQASLDFLSAANNELETVSVYPNPAINSIIVRIPFEESYSSYALYAINGAVVKEGSIDSNQQELPITFSDIGRGLYILQLTNSKGEEAFKKIVKE